MQNLPLFPRFEHSHKSPNRLQQMVPLAFVVVARSEHFVQTVVDIVAEFVDQFLEFAEALAEATMFVVH